MGPPQWSTPSHSFCHTSALSMATSSTSLSLEDSIAVGSIDLLPGPTDAPHAHPRQQPVLYHSLGCTTARSMAASMAASSTSLTLEEAMAAGSADILAGSTWYDPPVLGEPLHYTDAVNISPPWDRSTETPDSRRDSPMVYHHTGPEEVVIPISYLDAHVVTRALRWFRSMQSAFLMMDRTINAKTDLCYRGPDTRRLETCPNELARVFKQLRTQWGPLAMELRKLPHLPTLLMLPMGTDTGHPICGHDLHGYQTCHLVPMQCTPLVPELSPVGEAVCLLSPRASLPLPTPRHACKEFQTHQHHTLLKPVDRCRTRQVVRRMRRIQNMVPQFFDRHLKTLQHGDVPLEAIRRKLVNQQAAGAVSGLTLPVVNTPNPCAPAGRWDADLAHAQILVRCHGRPSHTSRLNKIFQGLYIADGSQSDVSHTDTHNCLMTSQNATFGNLLTHSRSRIEIPMYHGDVRVHSF